MRQLLGVRAGSQGARAARGGWAGVGSTSVHSQVPAGASGPSCDLGPPHSRWPGAVGSGRMGLPRAFSPWAFSSVCCLLRMQSEPLWVSRKPQKLPQRGLNVPREDGWREGEEARGPHGVGQWEACRGRPLGLEAALRVTPCPASVPSPNSWPLQAGRKMLLFPRPGSLRQDLLPLLSPPLAPVFLGNRPVGNMIGD